MQRGTDGTLNEALERARLAYERAKGRDIEFLLQHLAGRRDRVRSRLTLIVLSIIGAIVMHTDDKALWYAKCTDVEGRVNRRRFL